MLILTTDNDQINEEYKIEDISLLTLAIMTLNFKLINAFKVINLR